MEIIMGWCHRVVGGKKNVVIAGPQICAQSCTRLHAVPEWLKFYSGSHMSTCGRDCAKGCAANEKASLNFFTYFFL